VLRRDKVEHKHFNAGRILPVIGTVTCLYLVLPWTSGRALAQYQIAGVLLLLGVLLWVVTWFANRSIKSRQTTVSNPEDLT
jgi:basic amino acid/polyamine antiporter, APA family